MENQLDFPRIKDKNIYVGYSKETKITEMPTGYLINAILQTKRDRKIHLKKYYKGLDLVIETLSEELKKRSDLPVETLLAQSLDDRNNRREKIFYNQLI